MGGRTDNFCSFWHKDSGDQKFHYIHIFLVSPYLNSNCDYPVRHPEEILMAPHFDEEQDSQISLDKRQPNPECDRDDSLYSLPQTAVDSKILKELFLFS